MARQERSERVRGFGSALVASALLSCGLATTAARAQFPGLTLPPLGDNQKTVVTQYMGLVSVTLTYNSPDVTSPAGEDRTGEIWGKLVPYGLTDPGFGTAEEAPWRVGANENTTISFSHDVEVEGRALAAGTYGVHMIPGQNEWVEIFLLNAELHPGEWPVDVGLARTFEARGDTASALEHARIALTRSPNRFETAGLEAMIARLEGAIEEETRVDE